MQRYLQSLGALSIVAVCFHQGCVEETSPADPTGSGPQAAANGGAGTAGLDPACNFGRPNGFCNVFGGDPETCECLDCKATAWCQQRCVDDGACNLAYEGPPAEDCSCADCAYVHPECGLYQGDDDEDADGEDNDGEQSSSVSTGEGGAGSTAEASSAEASTAEASTAEASTAEASTADTTASGNGGAGGG